jgi:hypothetical protein
VAILLLYDRNNTHPDPVKDVRGCYKRGDIVEVFEDDKPVAVPVQPPWAVIKIAGPTKAQAMKYMAEHAETQTCVTCTGTGLLPPLPEFGLPARTCERCHGSGQVSVRLTRRRFRVRWDDLPTIAKDALRDSRYFETTWAASRAYIRDKVTGLDE